MHSGSHIRRLLYALCLAVLVATFALTALPYLDVNTGASKSQPTRMARLKTEVSVHAAGLGNPTINLSDGHELLTSYVGPLELQSALEENRAEPLSLASADFDEDGVPDLVSGYEYEGQGIVTLLRGNVDSIYPNAPEAQQRKATGTFTNAPFLSPARVFASPVAVDFIGAGDFNADGHWDLVIAARSHTDLFYLAGNGQGQFAQSGQISLPGVVTAMLAGEINRRDGLTDIVVGVAADDGPQVLVFEGPLGALRANPEVLRIPARAESIALGELDSDYPIDLLVAAGNRLELVHGRDRKLTLPDEDRATVAPPLVTERVFSFNLQSVSIGDFTGDGFKDIAVLSADGGVHFLTQPPITQNQWNDIKRGVEDYTAGRKSRIADAQKIANNEPLRILPEFDLSTWQETATDLQKWTGAQWMIATRNSSVAADTLVVLDAAEKRLHVVSPTNGSLSERGKGQGSPGASVSWEADSLKSDTAPVSILPMRLDTDALSDLVVLRKGATKSTIVFTSESDNATAQNAPYVTFTNSTFFFVDAFFSTPGKSSPYPSTIDVSGISDPNSKIRVKLNRFGSTRPSVVDLLLVSPAGQKVMLMSDAGGTGLTSENNITFDDGAANFIGAAPVTGTFKPTNVDDGPTDSFPSPAPAPPYASTLSAFNGNNLNGTWSLFGVDDGGGGTSQQSRLESGWTLIFGDDPLPQDFVVNSAADTDDGTCNAANCTLREAINAANAKPAADRIIFNIDPGSGGGLKTITPQTSLPSLTEAVTIDGTTQPGFSGVPIIELNGSNAGGNGLVLLGGNSVVRGLVVNRFGGRGIVLLQGGSNIVEGNYIGIDTTGTLDLGNSSNGVDIDTANNTVGGTVAAARNVISGNNFNGILFGTFYSDPAEANRIQGNYIGTNATGTALIRNEFNGISTNSAPGSPNNTIGGTTAGARNVIVGSIFSRVDISYIGSSGTLVQGNFIGTDITGTLDLDGSGGQGGSGSGDGIDLSAGVGDCLIGGTTPAARNLISGNWYGVFINTNNVGSPPPTRNLVQGNFIGTKVNGTQSLPNLFSGVRLIFGATSNTIGGDLSEARNIISGNSKAGIQIGEINFASTFTNVIKNNYIGTDVSGNNPLANGNNLDPSGGIIIPANADGDRIERNRIAYNFGSGIRITNVGGNNQPGIRILIAENEIFANTKLGIDLGDVGITPNDPLDTDVGANLQQNFPVLNSITPSGAAGGAGADSSEEAGRRPQPPEDVSVNIGATLNSTPNTTFTINWYFSADSQCTNNQQGSRPLSFGKVPGVTTNASGDASFSIPFDFPVGTTSGVINTTATDPVGNTSEYSACLPVSAPPSCSFTLSGAGASVGAGGGSGSVGLTASAGSCAWTASSNAGWLTITSGASGTGSGTINYSAAANTSTTARAGVLTIGGQTYTVSQTGQPVTQLTSTSYSVNEGAGFASIAVTRTGDLSAAASVKYQSSDSTDVNFRCDPSTAGQAKGVASRKCDYHIAVGRLRFNAGESTRQVVVSIVDDAYVEGSETLTLTLSNPVGVTLGSVSSATVTITDNDTSTGANPISGTRFYVRQLYVDLLSREPEPAGWDGWVHRIDFCGQPGEPPPPCDRVTVGGDGFLRSGEFFDRQFFVLRLYKTAFGRILQYSEVGDLAYVSGFLSSADLELNKQELVAEIMTRPEFTNKYGSLGDQAFVDTLLQTAGVTLPSSDRSALITSLGANTKTKAQVFREISERPEVSAKHLTESQVVSAYYGFFTRNPDGAYISYLNRLNSGEINLGDLANAFINAQEYVQRFGP